MESGASHPGPEGPPLLCQLLQEGRPGAPDSWSFSGSDTDGVRPYLQEVLLLTLSSAFYSVRFQTSAFGMVVIVCVLAHVCGSCRGHRAGFETHSAGLKSVAL